MAAPLIDPELADQIFLVSDEAEVAGLREMLADFERETAPRFETLHEACRAAAADATVTRRTLHGLRGVVANFSFSLAAERLRHLETEWEQLAPPARLEALQAGEAAFQDGLAALRERYPHLRAGE